LSSIEIRPNYQEFFGTVRSRRNGSFVHRPRVGHSTSADARGGRIEIEPVLAHVRRDRAPAGSEAVLIDCRSSAICGQAAA
jgi:hypothetical protein